MKQAETNGKFEGSQEPQNEMSTQELRAHAQLIISRLSAKLGEAETNLCITQVELEQARAHIQNLERQLLDKESAEATEKK